jgi:hypothetical protein
MGDYRQQRSKIETEKDLTRTVGDYLALLSMRREVLFWRDHFSRWNKAGFPDYFVLVKGQSGRIHTLYLELKTPKGRGRLTPEQIAWRAFIGEDDRHRYVCSNDFYEVKDIIDTLLKG